jgi:hypothetical protein
LGTLELAFLLDQLRGTIRAEPGGVGPGRRFIASWLDPCRFEHFRKLAPAQLIFKRKFCAEASLQPKPRAAAAVQNPGMKE